MKRKNPISIIRRSGAEPRGRVGGSAGRAEPGAVRGAEPRRGGPKLPLIRGLSWRRRGQNSLRLRGW